MVHYFNELGGPLRANGYDPIPITPQTKACYEDGWPWEVFEPDSRRWRWHGVGHRCRTVGAMDADITDIELSYAFLNAANTQIAEWEEDRLYANGEAWRGLHGIRIGKAPKWLSLVRNAYGGKRRSAIYDGHCVEFLGAGQQCLLYGRYPGLNKEYEWLGHDPMIVDSSDLVEIDEVRVAVLFGLFEALCEHMDLEKTEERTSKQASDEAWQTERRQQYLIDGREGKAFGWLRDRGYVKERKGPGKYELTCPWGGEHSNGKPDGACIWLPVAATDSGIFTCLHNTCSSRGMYELMELINETR